MKRKILIACLVLMQTIMFAQTDTNRFDSIRTQINELSSTNPGFNELFKTDIQVQGIDLTNFIIAISNIHNVNLNVDPNLKQQVRNNFTNVTVGDLLVFLCKEYNLTIDFTGNILSIKKYIKKAEPVKEKIIPVVFSQGNNTISLNAKGDKLYDVFKRIIDETGKNLVFSPGLENTPITAYIKNIPFDSAMDKLAFANNLYVEKTKDGFYSFEQGDNIANEQRKSARIKTKRPNRRQKTNFYYKILDAEKKLVEVDLVNTPISDVINAISKDLDLDIFTATPLIEAGVSNFKTKSIYFDDLLNKMFEGQKTESFIKKKIDGSGKTGQAESNLSFTFKKDKNIYFFGLEKQLSVRTTELISLQYRSVQLLTDPSDNNRQNRNTPNYNSNSSNFDNFSRNQGDRGNGSRSQTQQYRGEGHKGELVTLKDLIPGDLLNSLDIKTDTELNSFYINGTASNVNRFKHLISKIDKPVPVVLIEVMLIEVLKSSSVETGIDWGIGTEPTTTSGTLFPNADVQLGAKTINKIIGGFDGFGSLNLGKVVPNFFANIKALETNGDVKVRSAPKLSTLNGHKAYFSNSQTSYYAVTQRNIYGTDNPQTSEITNYEPIDAELGLTIKPYVSKDGSITLDISVIQSNFGDRIAENAPPNISSREFTSIIRMNDKDIAILGGLEEQRKENSGTGVPFLARVPIIKWFFSKRKRVSSNAKLTVLIKPTILY